MTHTKIIAVMGDSHTWGEGVGAEYGFRPAVVCADKRMLSFAYPAYVNLLRAAVNLKTGSRAREIITDELAGLCGAADGDYGILTPDNPVTVTDGFTLARLFLFGGQVPARVTAFVDGQPVCEVTAQSSDPSPAVSARLMTLHTDGGAGQSHTLTLRTNAPVRLHRIELYDGSFAVVNCGIGSCPVGRYVDDFFADYIAALRPYAVLFEGHTINDWLSGETPEAYAADLTRAVSALRDLTPRVLAHSVFPIAGSQVFGSNPVPYVSYVTAMKDTVTALGVPFVDTYATCVRELSRVPEARREQFLYHDPWHPNGTGHAVYAREIWERASGGAG